MSEFSEGFGGIGKARTDPVPQTGLTAPAKHVANDRDKDTGEPRGHDSFAGKNHK